MKVIPPEQLMECEESQSDLTSKCNNFYVQYENNQFTEAITTAQQILGDFLTPSQNDKFLNCFIIFNTIYFTGEILIQTQHEEEALLISSHQVQFFSDVSREVWIPLNLEIYYHLAVMQKIRLRLKKDLITESETDELYINILKSMQYGQNTPGRMNVYADAIKTFDMLADKFAHDSRKQKLYEKINSSVDRPFKTLSADDHKFYGQIFSVPLIYYRNQFVRRHNDDPIFTSSKDTVKKIAKTILEENFDQDPIVHILAKLYLAEVDYAEQAFGECLDKIQYCGVGLRTFSGFETHECRIILLKLRAKCFFEVSKVPYNAEYLNMAIVSYRILVNLSEQFPASIINDKAVIDEIKNKLNEACRARKEIPADEIFSSEEEFFKQTKYSGSDCEDESRRLPVVQNAQWKGTMPALEHELFDTYKQYLAKRGWVVDVNDSIRGGNKNNNDPYTEISEDETGVISKTIYIKRTDRWIDFLHEVGHVKQFERFEALEKKPFVTCKTSSDKGRVNETNLTNPYHMAILELDNRLHELSRLTFYQETQSVLQEHIDGVAHWTKRHGELRHKVTNKQRFNPKNSQLIAVGHMLASRVATQPLNKDVTLSSSSHVLFPAVAPQQTSSSGTALPPTAKS